MFIFRRNRIMDKLLSEIKDSFEELDDLLNFMFVPFSLQTINESRLTEADESSILDDYKSYKSEFKNIINLVAKFVMINKPIEDKGFTKNINRRIRNTMEFYDDISINSIDDKLIEKVNNAYFAYMTIVRALNTAIRDYNIKFSNYSISELDIDEPKYIEYNVDLKVYLEELIKNINKIL